MFILFIATKLSIVTYLLLMKKSIIFTVLTLSFLNVFAQSPEFQSQKTSQETSSYCTSNLGGGAFDLLEVSITGTTLNNNSQRSGSGSISGSYYLAYPASGSNTCTLSLGTTYSLNVTTNQDDIISVWIDYNQNGIYDLSEWTQVTTSASKASVQITIPNSAISGTTGLRIRTRASSNSNGSSDACTSFGSGCTEDYIITIGSPIPTKPSANFYANTTIGTVGNSIELNDISTGVPTSWKWTFTGGTPSTSTTKNPTVSYAANGVYPVKLAVTNALGSDSITKLGYITISNSVNIPVTGNSSVTACGVTIYDNGGTSTYSTTSDGTLTIYPGTTGSAVKLQFSQFNIDSGDYLYVYNGPTASTYPINTYYGTTIPTSITASNSTGALTLRFTSDGWGSNSGFVAQSSCADLVLQNITNMSWYTSVDYNQNGYSQNKTLSYSVTNNDTKSATIIAKIYGKLTTGGTYALLSTSSFVVQPSSDISQNASLSGFTAQGLYDFKVELYNASNKLLTTYDLNNNSIMGGQRCESALEDISPTYCTSALNGGSFDISAVSITGTSLNNISTRPSSRPADGSYYALFPTTGSNTATLTSGYKYYLNVTTQYTANISVWIDYNQDQSFQANEWVQVATSSVSGIPSKVALTIPSNALPGQTRMRIRTNYYYYSNTATDACSNFYNGCTEDYTITIVEPVLAKPTTDFDVSQTNASFGSTLQFSDLSTGVPDSWKWTFSGGTPSTSSIKNPSVSYSAPGTYDVKLVVSNSLGKDSLIKTGYVTIVNSINVPVSGSNSVTACGITIYDNGGPSNYVNSSNGSLTIYPTSTGNAVRLQFSMFNTEGYNDILYIYNGTSTSAPLIGSYYGNTIPPTAIATNSSGALTIAFRTDGSSVYSGFEAQATCIPLTTQYISSTNWTGSVDYNYNGYAQTKSLNFTVKNDEVNAITLYAKIYSKTSSSSTYSLNATSSNFSVGGLATSTLQTTIISNLPTQDVYDFKIELYNAANTLLGTYDLKSYSTLGSQSFESTTEDGPPSYCIGGLAGGSFDISSVSITGTTLNNNAVRNAVRTNDGSYYTLFAPSSNNTCTLNTGKTYTLKVTTKNVDKISAWIDYNKDLIFQANEWIQVATTSTAYSPSSISFTIPGSTPVGQTNLRIRSSSSTNTNGSSDACSVFSGGCTEDYTITISTPVLAKPTVDFAVNETNTSIGSTIEFVDLTNGIPSSLKWTFTGGSPASSTSSNPQVTYNTPGVYNVKLVATNSLGTDSLTKTAYITVVNAVKVPISGSNSITACGVTIYDNGGTSNYSDSSNGVLIINPANAGEAVKLQFSEFNTDYSDALRVYNGTSTSATLIGTYYGSNIPNTIRATNTSGALTLKFTSDGSYNYNGFTAQATCIPLVYNYINTTNWSNSIDNNYNGYAQSRVLNIVATNSSSKSATLYAKIFYKLTSSSSYSLYGNTVKFNVNANSISETILFNVSNLSVAGYYDFKLELYDSSNSLLCTYDMSDNTNLKNQGFEPVITDGFGSYCNYNLGGNGFDISLVSITGTTLYNDAIRPLTGSYASYTASGNQTGIVYCGSPYTINITTNNNDIISVWIDYNHNGNFEASEWTQVTTASNNTIASSTISIPSNSVVGPTKLRIRTRSAGTSNFGSDACTSFSSGCTEDYQIYIDKTNATSSVSCLNFKIYPNPATNKINISTPGLVTGTMDITDILGRRIISKAINGEFNTEDVSNLKSGSYIINIVAKDGASVRKQVVIRR